MLNIFSFFFEVSRFSKRVITLACDFLFVLGSLILAFYIRLGADLPKYLGTDIQLVMLFLAPCSIFLWIRLGLYRAIIRYIDIKVLGNILWGALGSVFTLIFFSFIFRAELPRSVPFIYFALILISVAGSRLLVRGLINAQNAQGRTPVAIYGAGSAGRQLCLSLQNGSEYSPVFFVDDSAQLRGAMVSGVKVFASEDLPTLIQKHHISKVLFAIPSANVSKKKEIFNSLQSLHVEILTIPGSADLVSGKVSLSQLRTVDIHDLLGREPVTPNSALINKCTHGKAVMVTGAGGSIGSELCRQIMAQNPKCLVLFDHSEYNLYEIEQELSKQSEVRICPILGSVQNSSHVEDTIKHYGIDTIYHAAAYKHVPIVEQNNISGIYNNIWGTKIVAELAKKHGVAHFVLVSTDKAVRPTNLMGASKRVAELVLQAMAATSTSTVFSMVRFGNVLGSSGSVVPLFRKQIEQGGPVTVTHPDITRYFMTIPEAASLVIQAGAMATGGEVFVLDMGQPVKIVELAEKMIHLMGYEVKSEADGVGDIAIKFSGLRPGEKLYEELLIGGDVEGTSHPRIMQAKESCMGGNELNTFLNSLKMHMDKNNVDAIRELMRSAPTGYSPDCPIVDLLAKEMSSGIVDSTMKLVQ